MLSFLARLAAKNLMRQKRRTILTFLTLSIGIFSFISVDALLRGLDRMAIDNLTKLESGHIQVFPKEYFDERDELPLDYTFTASKWLNRIQALESIKAVTPRLSFSGRINNGVDELPVTAIGIDPAADEDVFDLTPYLSGQMPQAGTYQAIIGSSLAELMELSIGDYFTLITRTKSGAFQAIDLQITGLADTPHPEINTGTILLPLDVAAGSLGVEGEATALIIRATSYEVVPSLVNEINQVLGGKENLRAYSWKDIAADFLTISQSERLYDSILLMLIFLIGTVGVVNTILLGAMERVKEIGVMKAMGLSEREIVIEFSLEAAGIGLLGALSGAAIGAAINFYLVNVGFDLTAIVGDMSIGYPITGRIYAAWNIPTIITSFLFGIGACLVASYLPARAAAAKDPVQSLQQG